jgi:TonB-linked SusC/RagA family outer membrane protein
MKHFYLILLLCLLALSAQAQVRVSGRVTDEKTGEALIGVSISVKNGASGTSSDFEGRFVISVADPATAVLMFRYTGFAEKEYPLQGRTSIEISMSESDDILNEVVVVGYGTQKKSDLTGAVGTVKGKDMERIATPTFDQALQGKLAGVFVTPVSGEPGAGAVIRVRGTGTLNNANPIFVVDGMITYDASLINPQDVASVEVLKDASACAIYGARGANGVIIVTTKSGKKGERSQISLSSYYGTQALTRKLNMLNASEFAEVYNDLVNKAYYPDPAALGEGTDWQDQIFRQAPMGNLQVAATGGGEKHTYNASVNYFNQSGILRNDELERITVRLNNEYQVNKWLKLGNNTAYANLSRQLAPQNVIGGAYRMPPVFAPKDSTGDFTDPTSPFGLAVANPAADLFYKSRNKLHQDRLFGNVYGEISFLKHFTFRSNFGFDLLYSKYRAYEPIFQVSASQLNKDDKLNFAYGEKRDWIWEQTLNYHQEWDNHSLHVLAGYTSEERRYEEHGAGRRNFPGSSDLILYLSAGNDTTQTNYGGASDEALISYLFRTNYTFMDRYLLTFSMRVDQSSRFASGNRTGYFPSFSLGWNLGQESFIENLGLFDRLKLRGSYGILGNQASAQQYPSFGTVATGLYSIFGPGEDLNQGATLVNLGNPGLRWETARQTDFGLEFGLFKGRLQAEIDWYNRYTYDIIAAVPIPDYVGSGSDPVVNTAKVRNRGWDISLNWRNTGPFSWNIGANLSPVKNELIELNNQKTEILSAFLQGEPATRSAPGLPIGSFYGYQVAGVFQTAEEVATSPRLGNEGVGDLKFKDLNGDGVIDEDDRTNLGSPIPNLTYAFTVGFDWKGFDFVADLLGVRGNKVFNAKQTFRFAVYNWEQRFYNRWTPENPSNTQPQITNGGHNYRVSDFFIEDGSYLRLRSMVLGYSLPIQVLKKLNLTRLRVYAGGNNIWTKQKYSGYSPEFSNASNPYNVGLDGLGYPITKTWQFGLDVTF